jgi:uncharacterized repeat protein (TIGR03803 family)
MRTWAYFAVLIGIGPLLTACSGSQPPLSASPQELPSQQSMAQRAFHIIHPFGRSTGDGTRPAADLIDVNGTLYGTTMSGGSNNAGTAFSITASGQETVLHSFGGPGDGVYPVAALLSVNGTFYGTTEYGGASGGGTVFSMAPDGSVKVLHNFVTDYPDSTNTGSLPIAPLIDVNGVLYGTTSQGGKHLCNDGYTDCGTVFSITTSGKYTLLHSFGQGARDGTTPAAAVLDVDGTLYGTASQGGEFSNGTVYTITPSGQYKTLYNFGTNPNDSKAPTAALINVNGTLYGTESGESNSGGAAFSITPSGVETNLHSFGGDGTQPYAGLTYANGLLYGTTNSGGVDNDGTVFSLTTSGDETVVHSFAKGKGVNPVAGVTAVDGTLYGTTYGQTAGKLKRTFGNVYSLKP